MTFQWTHYSKDCTLCKECVDTCGRALRVTNLRRIKRDPNKCTQCETCSTICGCIETEF